MVGRNVWRCGFQSEKEKAKVRDIERKASVCPALASVSVQGGDSEVVSSLVAQGSGGGHAQSFALETQGAQGRPVGERRFQVDIDTHTCIRIWGERPFQADEDNDAAAKAHWRSVCDLQSIGADRTASTHYECDPASEILSQIQTLNPGHGPGLPAHLPVSIDTLAGEAILKVATGKTFMLFLAESGAVYSLGVGKQGELGLGDKLMLVRTPFKIPFSPPCERYFVPAKHDTPQLAEPSPSISLAAEDFNLTQSKPLHTIPGGSIHCLGVTATASSGSPQELDVVIKDVACGDHHAMALDKEGRLWIWGARESTGMRLPDDLFVPTIMSAELLLPKEDRLRTVDITGHSIPQAVAAVSVIGASARFSAAITTAGRFLMWGSLPGGHLARAPELIGIFTKYAEPITKMEFGLSMGLMLTEAGNLFQLGVGTFGEILNKNAVQRQAPVQDDRANRKSSASNPRSSTTGASTDNRHPAVLSVAPRRIQFLVPEFLNGLVDTYGEKIPPLKDVSVGDRHVLLLARDANVYAYGSNYWGQCGTGPQKQIVTSPTLVTWAAGGPATRACRISAGGRQSGLLSEQNRAYMWGCNSNFRLIVDAVKEFLEYPLVSLVAGDSHVLAQTHSSRLGVCTEAGIHNSKFTPQPVPALAPFKVTLLAVGWSYTVVVTGKPPPRTIPSYRLGIPTCPGSRHRLPTLSDQKSSSQELTLEEPTKSRPTERVEDLGPYTASPVSLEQGSSETMSQGTMGTRTWELRGT